MSTYRYSYGTAILAAFEYLLENYTEVFLMGQGLWSPWYVGNTMTDLDKKFGIERVIDTPVSSGIHWRSSCRIFGWHETNYSSSSYGFYALCFGPYS